MLPSGESLDFMYRMLFKKNAQLYNDLVNHDYLPDYDEKTMIIQFEQKVW